MFERQKWEKKALKKSYDDKRENVLSFSERAKIRVFQVVDKGNTFINKKILDGVT